MGLHCLAEPLGIRDLVRHVRPGDVLGCVVPCPTNEGVAAGSAEGGVGPFSWRKSLRERTHLY